MAKENVTPDLYIKRPYYGAFKEFGWKEKDWGWGISLEKLGKLEARGLLYITVRLEKTTDIFEVVTAELRRRIEKRGSYNYNGSTRCGYITKSDLFELARNASKVEVAETKEAKNASDGLLEILEIDLSPKQDLWSDVGVENNFEDTNRAEV